MKLYAISDLHVGHRSNREALAALRPHPRDWLVLAGDVGETEEHLAFALSVAIRRFAKVIWAPGNHELWTPRAAGGADDPVGEAKYARLVEVCRRHGVLTPEDPYPVFRGAGGPLRIAPLFLLYDYSIRPDDVPFEAALAWAEESGVVCTDEYMIRPAPHASTADWCAARLAATERRLAESAGDGAIPLVLVNHFPLREEHACLPAFPRFSLWCGTRATRDWHLRFPVAAVVYGHMHQRGTSIVDGVRFEEVSLGYPADWDAPSGVEAYLRQISPVASGTRG